MLCLCTAGESVTKHALLNCTGIKLTPAGPSATLDIEPGQTLKIEDSSTWKALCRWEPAGACARLGVYGELSLLLAE